MTWFDESRLDDEIALGSADLRLRTLAESGARVRREAGAADGRDRRGGRPCLGRPPACGHRGRARLPAAPRGAGAVVPGAVRGLAVGGPPRLGRQPRPGRGARARRLRHRHGVRRRRGRAARLPGGRRLPRRVERRPARRRTLDHHPADEHGRPARDRGRDAVVPPPDRARSAVRSRCRGRGARRRRHRRLAPARHLDQPREDAGDLARRRGPAGLGRVGAGGPRRPPGRRVDPPYVAGAPRSPATPSTCSP